MKCEECGNPWSVRLDRGQNDDLKTKWLCHECITIQYGQLVALHGL